MGRKTTYIILFRGVGGATLLPVQPLKAALLADGFEKVVTYINTGNVVLVSDRTPKQIVARIAAICLEKFSFSKSIMIVSKAAWKKVIADNPFPESASERNKLHAYILDGKPDNAAIEALARKNSGPEQFAVAGKVLYYYPPQGAPESKLFSKIESTLKVAATARNWNTVINLAHLAEQVDKGEP